MTAIYRIFLAGLLACLPTPALLETVVFDANESPPYWLGDRPGQGLGGEVLHALSEMIGVTAHIRFRPLARMIEDTANNDLGNPVFFMANQEFSSIIPIAVYQASVYYYQPNHPKAIAITRLADLKRYKIGILKGTLLNRQAFEQHGIEFETSYRRESIFRKLKLGRIDLALEIDLVARATIERVYPMLSERFVGLPIPGAVSPIAILIGKPQANGRRIGARYRQALARLIESGRYQKILDHYYGAGKTPADWYRQLARFDRLYQFSLSNRAP